MWRFAAMVGSGWLLMLVTVGDAAPPSPAGDPPKSTEAQAAKAGAQVGRQQTRPVNETRPENAVDDSDVSYWMEKKLDYSQSLLRALAGGDFDAMRSNAEQMRRLNRIEGFVRRRNPDYQQHVQTFERVTAQIVRQAERENIEGVTLAFNQLTISCVSCHQALREAAANQP